jgi:hypothetical protein
MLTDLEYTERIGEFWGYPESRSFAELPIDCEEDRRLRVVLVGMLREAGHSMAASHANRPCRGVALQAGSVVALVRPISNR